MTAVTGIEKHSGLYRYLRSRGLRKAARLGRHPRLRVSRLGGSHEVFLVKDEKSHKKLILKSFEGRGARRLESHKHMRKEYGRLRQAGRLVNRRDWVHVVRPVCKSDEGDFFAEQYVSGSPLGRYMKDEMSGKGSGELYDKLAMLAGFFGLMHKKTRRHSRIKTSSIRQELLKHARQAGQGGAFTPAELKDMESLIDEACSLRIIRHARKSLVHGDANPSNFLYGRGRLNVIDMERASYRDPAYDLGMMAGELCHYAMQYGGDPYRADPFIGHLYWTYAGNYEDQLGTFIRLTKRNPLYMANSLLRIARHPFFNKKYKRRLAFHARECLISLRKFSR
jgi:aminoglycoside phosphotransferase (APT) family kinase protein